MLGDVVAIEKAELEETKNKIIQSVANDKKKLKQYEDGILEDLESASGNILDNQKVLNAVLNTHTSRGCTHAYTRTTARAYTHRIPGSLNRAKRRSPNRKVVGSIPGAGMSGGGRRQPCVKCILSGEIAK